MECTTTVSLTKPIDGKTGNTFYLKWEMRQENPIPFYFPSMQKYLGIYIRFMSNQKNSWIGVRQNIVRPNISYFMFADDCLLLC